MQMLTSQINFSGLYWPPAVLILSSDQKNSLTIANTYTNQRTGVFVSSGCEPAS